MSWHSLPLHYYTTILYTPLYTTTINHNHTYHYILKYTTLLQTTHPHTMSSPQPTIQYVYIPNLVGKQVLRVPVLPCEDQILDSTPVPPLG